MRGLLREYFKEEMSSMSNNSLNFRNGNDIKNYTKYLFDTYLRKSCLFIHLVIYYCKFCIYDGKL